MDTKDPIDDLYDESPDEAGGKPPGRTKTRSYVLYGSACIVILALAAMAYNANPNSLRFKGSIAPEALAQTGTDSVKPAKGVGDHLGSSEATESDPLLAGSSLTAGEADGASGSVDSLAPDASMDKFLGDPSLTREGRLADGPVPVPEPRFTLADVIVSAADEETAVKIGNLTIGAITSRYDPGNVSIKVYMDVENVTTEYITATFRGISTGGKVMFGGDCTIPNKGKNADIMEHMGETMRPQIDEGLKRNLFRNAPLYFSTYSSARVFTRNEARPQLSAKTAKRK